ncbi:toxin co-regulated pilus biosynthesis Q family protein [Aestuariibacter halophilus]|uniref:Toxin co-regulated pilus biosynthesis Q family protein n=1 Tax=Fluctibacter halophilus TaxID=226011 RepID=A0ABS8G306_9ALTE|nr:TcpQ domain-containing protein [Aestuariibacter halophilus]MCC2614843.1 toxin co-regulated pilus biosynthesis Q family protein [Aestuariibacter halophilus]
MAKKNTSNTLFWVRHLGLALALIILAAVMITLKNSRQDAPVPDGAPEKKSVAKNMTDFYASYRMSSSKPFEEDIGDFVMEVNEEDEPLGERLQDMESLQKPVSERWVGEHKHRSFKAGSTLREAITNYAQNEGMQVLWELDRDFIIKHHFQMDDTVVGSLGTIAQAIDSSFEGEVVAYICPKQRSLVITNKNADYLLENCRVIKPS